MDIIVYTGAPGSRKTLTLLEEIASTPGRYLVAFPRTPLIDEQADYCRKQAKEIGTQPSILPIHSDQSNVGQVGRRIEKTLAAEAAQPHVVIMVSHAALLALDPALLSGWHIAIDENLDGSVVSNTFKASASWSLLNRLYRLVEVTPGLLWQVMPRDEVAALTRSEIAADGESKLLSFMSAASDPGRAVFVDIGDWKDAKAPQRKVGWWSIWTPLLLDQCASVTFTGAGYFESLPCRATHWLDRDAITYHRRDLSAGVLRASPRVRIHFYTQGHVGSTTWWETEEGNRCLVAISRHQETIGGPGYWSANADIQAVFRNRFGGVACAPKQAGTNSLIEQTSCLFVYSAKPQEGDGPILKLLGLGPDVIRCAREVEDIRQFVMRGALRRPDYDGTYDIYLYDLTQAQDLDGYLRTVGITDVEIVPVEDAGIMDVTRPQARISRPSAPPTDQERKEQNKASQQRRRAKLRADREAAGLVRPRGRPRKPVDQTPIAP